MAEKRSSDLKMDDSLENDVNASGFEWIDFYTKFATKLLQYKADREGLINKIQPVLDNFFNIAGRDCPRLANEGEQLIDIDPFTIFALFNWKVLSDDLKKIFISELANEFEIDAVTPDKFDGRPTAFNMKVAYYNTQGKRGEHDIDRLWDLFEAALALEENDTEANRQKFSNNYDIVYDQSEIGLSKLTTGLFWIRPYYFLTLDTKCSAFITNTENMPVEFVNLATALKLDKKDNRPKLKARDYLKIQDACKKVLDTGEYMYESIPELSYAAWCTSGKGRHENDQDEISEDNLTDESLSDLFEKCMHEYLEGKGKPNGRKNPLYVDIKTNIPSLLKRTGLFDLNKYEVKGGTGSGAWSPVPHIAIMNKQITTTTTKGVYIVYFFSKDGESVYLTLNQGYTEIEQQIKETAKQKGKTQINRINELLRQKAKDVQARIDNKNFAKDDQINLGENLTIKAQYYETGTIFYKKYEKDQVPPEEELLEDLKNMLEIYDEYAKEFPNNDGETATTYDMGATTKECLNNVKKYIESKGFTYPEGTIENFYLSLKSKPFVILAGVSGTGKTRLAKLFAEAVGANTDTGNNRYLQVPVRPDWSDSSDLFGHMDLNNNFIHGAIIDFIVSANDNKEAPYFLCLDEMNLARVEYYLSDILSLIETREFEDNEIKTDAFVNDSYPEKYQNISLPENLYIIGTVNMDETTFPFSKKVLDRANTIEFSNVDLRVDLKPQMSHELDAPAQTLGNEFLKTKYLLLKDCVDETDFVDDNCQKLEDINKILMKANAQVGYRVRDEIIFYLLNNKSADLLPNDIAMDNAIMQKILPRIQGSGMSVRSILCELFLLCVNDDNSSHPDANEIDDMIAKVLENSSNCLYKKSAEKIAFMIRRFDEDGFTSYWL